MAEEKPFRKTKRERFLDVGAKRTRSVLKRLQVLGNCSNRSSYEYTPEDVEKIFEAIERQLTLVRAKFEHNRQVDFDLG